MIEAPVNVARRGGREGRKESKLPGRSCRTGRLSTRKEIRKKTKKREGKSYMFNERKIDEY